MKVAIMQPYIFPYIGYWQLIQSTDVFVIYDDVNYIKNGWINRNYILSNGNKNLLTWSLKKASPNKKINEIELSEKINKEKISRTIKESYSKSKNFNVAFPLVEKIIKNEEIDLTEYIKYSIKEISAYLGLEAKILLASELQDNKELKAQDRVINMCSVLNADTYINSIGGLELYSFEDFKQSDVTLKFLKPILIEYEQLKAKEFIPYLSIIDVLMNNTQEEAKKLLKEYTLYDGQTD